MSASIACRTSQPRRSLTITAMTFAAILTGLVAPLAGLPLAADVYGAVVIVLALSSLRAMLRSG